MMRPEDEDEAGLVGAWRRGDALAARRVIALYGRAMTRVAFALCPRVEDAEEVVQDALLLAHRSLDRFDLARGNLRAWLVGVTANRARQVRRSQTRYGGLLARLRREPYVEEPASPAAADLAYARRRLAALPAREREAFVLVELEELSSVEAGRVMQIADATVRVLVSRARRRLEVDTTLPPPESLRAEGNSK